jgi:hypothetical protein
MDGTFEAPCCDLQAVFLNMSYNCVLSLPARRKPELNAKLALGLALGSLST